MSFRKYKMLSALDRAAIESEARLLLRDNHHDEAFGIMRGLHVLGYGDIHGSADIPNSVHDIWNLAWWFSELQQQVLREAREDSDADRISKGG